MIAPQARQAVNTDIAVCVWKGIMLVEPGNSEHLPLEMWAKKRSIFRRLQRIPFFGHYLKRRAFEGKGTCEHVHVLSHSHTHTHTHKHTNS